MLWPGGPALGGIRRTIVAGVALIAVGAVLAPFDDAAAIASVSVLMAATLVTAAWTDAPSGVALGVLAVVVDRVLLRPAGESWWPLVDSWDDAVIIASLLLAGVWSGVTAQHRRLLALRAAARWREVVLLRQWVTRPPGTARSEIDAAGHDLADLLGATGWEWDDSPDSAPGVDEMPVLSPDGSLSGRVVDLGEDRRRMPAEFAMPVRTDDAEIGCFRFRGGDRPVSVEARVVAGAIVERVARGFVNNARRGRNLGC